MTLVSAGWVVTGPKVSGDYMAAIKAGRIGAISNLWGPEETREVQRVAVEETRLGVPLLFAFDVIHGHRTIFPIPLAEAAAFDPDLWERTARAAAVEAAADGLALAFAPMLDVARDPRWGRIAESPGEDPWLAAALCRSQGARFPGRRHRPAAQPGGDRQAPRRLRSGHRRPRLRFGGHLRALVPRGLPAAVPRGRGRRRRRHHAGVPRPGRRADDGECRRVERSGARPLGVRRGHGQRPRGGRRAGRARRGRRTSPRRQRWRCTPASTST